MYVDRGEPNPTQQARLSRQAVEALRATGRIDTERPDPLRLQRLSD